jgi:hypothetical protein
MTGIRKIALLALVAIGGTIAYSTADTNPVYNPGPANMYSFQRITHPDLVATRELIRQNEQGPKTCRNYMDRSFLYRMIDYDTAWCKEYIQRVGQKT